MDRWFSGASLCSPFSNFRFDLPEPGSEFDRDRLAEPHIGEGRGLARDSGSVQSHASDRAARGAARLRAWGIATRFVVSAYWPMYFLFSLLLFGEVEILVDPYG